MSSSPGFIKRLKQLIGVESVRSFANRVGVAETAIRSYLSGRSLPYMLQLIKICETCGCTPNWLVLGGDAEPQGAPASEPVREEFFSARQVRLLIQMTEGFQTAAREFPSFPWPALPWRRNWLMYSALPALERAARAVGLKEVDEVAAAGLLGVAIARWAEPNAGLPPFEILESLACNAVGNDEMEGA